MQQYLTNVNVVITLRDLNYLLSLCPKGHKFDKAVVDETDPRVPTTTTKEYYKKVILVRREGRIPTLEEYNERISKFNAEMQNLIPKD